MIIEIERSFKYFRAVATGESTTSVGRGAKPGRAGAAGGRATPIRRPSTRVDILKSAAKAFRRLGYHGATVEQIAAALHMKKGNLYYYFKNKEEILFACHQYSLDRLIELLDEIERSGADRRREAAAADRRVRPHDPRRAARHGAVSRSRGAVAGAPQGGDRPPRRVRPRRAAGDRGRDGTGVFAPGDPKLLRLRAFRRRQLDPAVVQPGRPGELAGDRRSASPIF